jgi:hypothetical protein
MTMQRTIRNNKGITLAELRRFLGECGDPATTDGRLRARVGFAGRRGPLLKEISFDSDDAVPECDLSAD